MELDLSSLEAISYFREAFSSIFPVKLPCEWAYSQWRCLVGLDIGRVKLKCASPTDVLGVKERKRINRLVPNGSNGLR